MDEKKTQERRESRKAREKEHYGGELTLKYLYNPAQGAWPGRITVEGMPSVEPFLIDAFLKTHLILFSTVINLCNLDKAKIFSEAKKIRPYVVLTLDGTKRRTSVKKGLNAIFHEILSLDVPSHTKALQLIVDLHNKPKKSNSILPHTYTYPPQSPQHALIHSQRSHHSQFFLLLARSETIFIGDGVLDFADIKENEWETVNVVICRAPPSEGSLPKHIGKAMAEEGWVPKYPVVLVPGTTFSVSISSPSLFLSLCCVRA